MQPEDPLGKRIGFELELCAPRGSSRRALAHELAGRAGGRVLVGFKYWTESQRSQEKLVCELTPAYRVVGPNGELLCTLVDDNTIRADLNPEAPTASGLYRVVLDDLRLALWLESRSWGEDGLIEATLRPLLETFDGELTLSGHDGAVRHPVAVNPWGHPLAVVTGYKGERERVCEVVSAPLPWSERDRWLDWVLPAARDLEFFIPREAALHVHLDAGPWRQPARLCALIDGWARSRAQLRETWKTNPNCRQLAAPTEEMLAVVRGCDPGTEPAVLAERLLRAGVSKHMDFSLLGVLQPRPRQPTLEVRALPMALDEAEIKRSVSGAEAFLRQFL